jgi:hypothetical protein
MAGRLEAVDAIALAHEGRAAREPVNMCASDRNLCRHYLSLPAQKHKKTFSRTA